MVLDDPFEEKTLALSAAEPTLDWSKDCRG
jgi:hypothetical protein